MATWQAVAPTHALTAHDGSPLPRAPRLREAGGPTGRFLATYAATVRAQREPRTDFDSGPVSRPADPSALKNGHPTIAAAGDAPVVVVFAGSWLMDRAGSATERSIRAELRGLGATLVAFFGGGVWSFRADDDVESRGTAPEEELARVRALFRVAAAREGTTQLAVFVLDDKGVVQFADARELQDDESAEEALLVALSAAGRAMTYRTPLPVVFSRREIVLTSLLAGFLLTFGLGCEKRPTGPPSTATPPEDIDADGQVEVALHVNGKDHKVRIDPRVSLLDALRERIGLTGTKKGCDHGQCGACTVLIDDRRVYSCLTLAMTVAAARAAVTTIEGLAAGPALHPMQQAFASVDALQCGYCTPGQIMSAVGLLKEGRAKTNDEVREEMSGNLCRCGAYPNIVAAIQRVRGEA